MSYTIRVYPQPHSIGARRNRAIRRQRALIAQQRRLMLLNQQLYDGFGMYSLPPRRFGGMFGSWFSRPSLFSWSGARLGGWGGISMLSTGGYRWGGLPFAAAGACGGGACACGHC